MRVTLTYGDVGICIEHETETYSPDLLDDLTTRAREVLVLTLDSLRALS